jgi:F-type H+/Na+-transporting ATPase subunit alpha
VAVIFSGTRGYLDPIPVSAVGKFEQQLLRLLREEHAGILGDIAAKKEITADTEKKLVGVLDSFSKSFAA